MLAHMKERPMVLLEMPHVSMRLSPRSMDMNDVADILAGVLKLHGWKTSCIVAHSFGTFIASRFCQMHLDLVKSVVGPATRTASYHLAIWESMWSSVGRLKLLLPHDNRQISYGNLAQIMAAAILLSSSQQPGGFIIFLTRARWMEVLQLLTCQLQVVKEAEPQHGWAEDQRLCHSIMFQMFSWPSSRTWPAFPIVHLNTCMASNVLGISS